MQAQRALWRQVADLQDAVAEAEDFLLAARPLTDAPAERLRQEAAALSCELLITLSRLRTRVELRGSSPRRDWRHEPGKPAPQPV